MTAFSPSFNIQLILTLTCICFHLTVFRPPLNSHPPSYHWNGRFNRWPSYYAYYGTPYYGSNYYYSYPLNSTYYYSYPSYYTNYVYPSYPYMNRYYINGYSYPSHQIYSQRPRMLIRYQTFTPIEQKESAKGVSRVFLNG